MIGRKALTSIVLSLALLCGVVYAIAAPETHAKPLASPAPSAAPLVPACVTEDGAGQALCTWDAQTQGNGMGTSILSGDCALDITGDEYTQFVCLDLHEQPSSEHEYQGATVSVPNGADLVQECNDDKRANVTDAGWSLIECYKAWL